MIVSHQNNKTKLSNKKNFFLPDIFIYKTNKKPETERPEELSSLV